MGCGKSKHFVDTHEGALQKDKNRIQVQFEPFAHEKENPDETEKAEDGENLKLEMGGKLDDVDAEALSRPEEATERQEMALLPPEDGTEHEALRQEEEQEVEKKDETLEENKDASQENEGLVGRLISHDSPDHYFNPRKDDEALEGIPSKYNSPLRVDASKPSQEVPVDGELKTKKEPAVAVVAEPMISAVEPMELTADGDQMNPAPSA